MNFERWRVALSSALQANAAAAAMVNPGRWTVRPFGSERDVLIEHVDGWLMFHASEKGSAEVRDTALLDLLTSNARLPGNIKHALCGAGLRPASRAELPLIDDTPIAERLKAVLDSFAASFGGGRRDEMPSSSNVSLSEIEELCVAAGWRVSGRDDDSVRIPLEIPCAFAPAEMRATPRGLKAAAVVAAADAATPLGAQARALLLLRAAAAIRWVRPAALEDGKVVFEVFLGSEPLVDEIGHGFAALSVALRLCAAETQVLGGDERIAHAYLQRAAAEARLAHDIRAGGV
ncbi:MAG TPA: hypothetical protein VMT89_02120 [Candidatus Acidoferrales bacterium]|nr:hypothetical protein [Candidatus Acidoferrales bacterium]